MNEFKDMLKYLRKREGISQAELALRLGITPSAIGNYESGTRKPTYEIEEALADYFNVTIDFLRGTDSERRNISNEEYEIILAYRESDDVSKEMVRRVLRIGR
jgi:transcriptional regulator with XRE-family HTH domain